MSKNLLKMPVLNIIISIMNENGWILSIILPNVFGKKPVKIPEPSRGGTGIRLKNPSKRFMIIIEIKMIAIGSEYDPCFEKRIKNLNRMKLDIDKRKLEPGPAREVNAIPLYGSLKLKGFTGTGFAHPKTKGDLIIIKKAGIIRVPNKSICLIGFKLILFNLFPVGSPILSAIQAWALS